MKDTNSKQIKLDNGLSENCIKDKPVKEITCNMCKQTFGRHCDLENHIKTKHENHVKYVHSNKQKYSCKDFDAKFKQKKNLKDHKLCVHDIEQYKEDYHDREKPKKFFRALRDVRIASQERVEKTDLNEKISVTCGASLDKCVRIKLHFGNKAVGFLNHFIAQEK